MAGTNTNSDIVLRRARTGLYAKGSSALRLRARKVAKLVERLRAVAPWIEGSGLPCARSWAECEIFGAAVFRKLAVNGVLNARGEAKRLLNDFQKLKKVQLAYENALGLTPASRMALKASGTGAALDLVAAMAAESTEDGVEVGDPATKTHPHT
jgi:hypothetical protein